MSDIYETFGTTVKKYRKTKGYSTQKLSKKLGISVGLLNNIENAKSDIFKIKLLRDLANELNAPLIELIQNKSAAVNDMSFDFKQNQLKIDLATENIHNIDLLNNYITLIIETFLKNLSEYEYNTEAIEVIGNHLLYELDSLNKIKKLDHT
ncbi:helix-turn-helix domain-containing protein [Clostridium ganghwense]|uniref:Helix-turn-helix transcriptional regulator n=1 Tax=Clostridium ganghwense TaxID=312089 RepID=A0ABT4CNL1_9CLOT|nr:helix-turn-helix transcriptional regulator [Clostridium ganghwense]MCY6370645.1 helix-turn-helix transcriptional regulator [Clostridium ganghwense]